MVTCDLCEELATDEEAAEHEEEIDSRPAPAAQPFMQAGRVTIVAVVIDEYNDDGQRPEMVQAGKTIYRGASLQEKRRNRMMNKMLSVR